ncbi:cache domain-containing protein [Peribacillus sp. B-H-3]|uniref:cache domain-containing protein n=1 Tax=Peribacillus sp. B-H-3 TaxID=3400420 RepID=UPI003B0113B1
MKDNNEIVENIGKSTGDTVTLFQYAARIATNVTLKGKREVGTQASQTVTDVVIQNGNSYFGEANGLGNKHQTAYIPIKDNQAQPIDMLYVGASSAIVDQTIHSIFVIFQTVLAILVAVAVGVVVLYNTRLRRRINRSRER